jgi:hypothetical protein
LNCLSLSRFSVKAFFALAGFEVLLNDLLVGEHGEANSVLLAIGPATDVSTAIVKEVNSLSVLQIILIVSMVSSS